MKKLFISLILLGASANLYGADAGTVSAFAHAENLIGEGELDSAATIIDSILNIPGFETDTMYGRVMVEKSTMHYYSGNITEMARAVELARGAVDPDGDQIVNVSLWNNLAVVHNRRESPDSALACYQRALEHARRADDASWQSALECNIGALYYNLERYAVAVEYFGNAVNHATMCDDGYTELASAQLAAEAYLKLNRTKEGGAFIHKAWNLAQESGDPSLQIRCMPTLMSYYEATAQPDSADYYMELGQTLLPSVSANGSLAGGFRSAKVHLDMSRGRYADALAELKVLRNIDFAPTETSLYRQMAVCLAGLGHDREAYLHMDSALMWSDTLAARDMNRAMAEFDVRYGTMQRELENTDLRNRVLLRERMLLGGGLLLTLVLILVLILVFRHRRLKSRMALERSEQYISGMEEERRIFARELHDGVAADLLALRLNIDGGNTPENIAGMAEQLRLTVRAISHRLMPPELSNQTLGTAIAAYAKAVGGDEASGIRIEFVEADMSVAIPEMTAREVYRIFQEEMANIIKYAGPSHIDISLQSESGNVLHLTIDHDGTPGNVPCDGSGIGRRTVADRLRIINARLQRSADANMSSVNLYVPL